MNESDFAALRAVDTPTVCNAIEVAQGRRGFDNFTHRTMLAADATLPPIVGYAKTARIRASRPPTEDAAVVRERRMAYYRYVADPPRPAVVLIEDVDFPDCVGAFWGEINVAVHKGFGIAGTVTNGSMRDLDAVAGGYQVLAESVGPSHAHVHVLEYDCPVDVLGLRAAPGDLIHADRHGAVVIPADIAAQLPAAIGKLLDSERLVLEPALGANFDFATFEQAWRAFEKSRT